MRSDAMQTGSAPLHRILSDVERQVLERLPKECSDCGNSNKSRISTFHLVVLALTAISVVIFGTVMNFFNIKRLFVRGTPKDKVLHWSTMRIAIFLTTHLPDQHKQALENCWPPMVQRSKMLQNSDVFLYTAEQPKDILLETAFNRTNGLARTQLYENAGYQEGAMLPVEEAIRNNHEWFGDYDWIIRLNPDVIIRNDSAFYDYMQNPQVDAILVNCLPETDIKVHTDFFAIRPQALPDQVVKGKFNNAERHFTAQIQHVLDKGRHVWLPNAGQSKPQQCRVAGVESPVIHRHKFLKHCATNFDHSDGLTY